MICQNCGTEIADKALVCFRCGKATFEAKVPPAPAARTRPRAPVAIAFVVVILAALSMSQAAWGTAPRVVTWVVAGLALVVLVWSLVARRR